MGSLGAMRARSFSRTATSRATSRTSTSSCPRASKVASRTRARSRRCSTSSWAALRQAMGYCGAPTIDALKQAQFVRITGRGSAREPSARRRDHEGRAQLPAWLTPPRSSEAASCPRKRTRGGGLGEPGGAPSSRTASARPRLRRAVRAADRAARPGRARLLRARQPPPDGGRDRAARPRRADPLGRSGVRLLGASAAARSSCALARRAHVGHLLRDAADGPRARRLGRGQRRLRVRQDRARGAGVDVVPRPARRADGLDEPPRFRRLAASRGDRHRQLADNRRRCVRGSRARGSTASSSIPRSSTRRTGRSS